MFFLVVQNGWKVAGLKIFGLIFVVGLKFGGHFCGNLAIKCRFL